MAVTHSTVLRNTSLTAGLKTAFDTTMVIKIYTGTPPGANAAQTGTLLGTLTGSATAFGAPATGVMTAAAIADDSSADATGTAGYFRMCKAADVQGATGTVDPRIEGTITATGGGGDMTLDNIAVTLGGVLHCTSFTYTAPT